ncbi:ankyrin repeat-containing protein At5g02620-like [Neltuma alba]|uniref:ankyrin repeat-containing protein At5g02620-like n=1 Tax=Neltuma alba TaxID=207710 RepID=UPI0010A42B8B|nr:ankyrin repeat-containing protein At5g02620-like [Prosopis alba]
MSQQESDQISILYEASKKGDVSMLKSLVRENSQIFHKISLSDFAETPLHISSSLGHREFTKQLLTLNRKLATELDYSNRTALHLASAEGHIEIVRKLAETDSDPCLYPDDKGRIPLYYAVMRGRVEVVRELIRLKPQSLDVRDKGETMFHLCIKHNRLETLKALVELELRTTGKLLNFNSTDRAENTILHSAIMLKQVETVRYLLSIPEVRQKAAAGLKNKLGLTVHDIVELVPDDFKTLEIRGMLNGTEPTTSTPGIKTTHQRNGWRKILGLVVHILSDNDTERLEEMRGDLSLVATVIATITFQALINPPGGFVQQAVAPGEDPFGCLFDEENSVLACPGKALSAVKSSSAFRRYQRHNTICFIGSLCITLILVSGVPLRHKPVIWVLSVGTCITLTFLTLTYLQALSMVNPNFSLLDSPTRVISGSLLFWFGMLGIVAVLSTLRFAFWLQIGRGKKPNWLSDNVLSFPRSRIQNA